MIATTCRCAKYWNFEELIDDPRFDNRDKVERADELMPIIRAEFTKKTTAEWAELLTEAGVMNAPVANYDDFMGDEHVQATNSFVLNEQPGSGRSASHQYPRPGPDPTGLSALRESRRRATFREHPERRWIFAGADRRVRRLRRRWRRPTTLVVWSQSRIAEENTMATVLSAAEVSQVRNDGHIAPIDVLPKTEAEELRGRLEAYEAEQGEPLQGAQRNKSFLLFRYG